MFEISEITEVVQYIDGLRAIVFDLDDTLYSEKEYVRSGYECVAKILPQINDAGQKLWTAFEEKQPAFDTVLMEENLFSQELKEKCIETYRQHNPNIHLYSGVAKMLVELRNSGMKIGIITDGRPDGQRKKIEALGLEKYVDYIIVTDELGGSQYRKPCEKAYSLMKDALKVDYGEMCYVGDNLTKDFMAPDKLGIRSIWFRNRDGLYY